MKPVDERYRRAPSDEALSRRELLVGTVAVAMVAGVPARLVASPLRGPSGAGANGSRPTPTTAPLRRYMTASALLPDGRVLVTGGYDRPANDDSAPRPMSSVAIYDPKTGQWSVGAPMATARARHAAVSLPSGSVAVLGGLGMNPSSSVEVYDPVANTWTACNPLAQPRYDHTAVCDGTSVLLFGGCSQAILSSVEIYPAPAGLGSSRGRNP